MKHITLKEGQDITIRYGDRAIVVGVGNSAEKASRGIEQTFCFYLVDNRNGEKHTSPTGTISYNPQDLLWVGINKRI